jgi:N-acetylmuramoyl-L-alanine amidase
MIVTHQPTPNFTTGRPRAIDMLVIHVTEGSAASVRSWFAAKIAQVSAHYMVTVDGAVDQFVRDEDQAWHAGRVDHPTAPLVLARPHVNPNAYSIGIEHEGMGTAPLTAPQQAASVALIRELCQRHSIPIDRAHIVGHHEIYSRKECPGKIDVDRLVALAAGALAASDYPRVVWSQAVGDYLVVTRYASDSDWSYVPVSTLTGGSKASTPLSQMPHARP